MPPLVFEECTVTHAPRSKQVSQVVLQQMLEDVAALINAAIAKPAPRKMEMWFGKGFTSNKDKAGKLIIAQTQKLSAWLASHQPLEFVTKDAGGTLAFADQANDKPQFFLGHGFPQSRWSWGERVCTLIHEFTHKAIATADVPLGETVGVDGSHKIMSYGMACLTLADNAGLCAKALENAENWGFYLCAYRLEAGVAVAKDPHWKFLEKSDWMNGRPSYLADREGHVDAPFMFSKSAQEVAKYLGRAAMAPKAAAPPPVPVGPERFPCECGQVFPAAFLHQQHLGGCHAATVRTQFHIPTALGSNGKPRSQAEHLQLAARRARELDDEED